MHTDAAKTAEVLKPKRFLFFTLLVIFFTLFFSCTTGKTLQPSNEGVSHFSPEGRDSSLTSSSEVQPHIRSVPLYPEDFVWEPITDGVQYTSFSEKSASVEWHLISVDLSHTSLRLIAYPSQEEIFFETQPQEMPDYGIPGTIQGVTVKNYAKKTKSFVAVNATPFNYTGLPIFPGRTLVGLHVHQGKQLSKPIKKYAALAFFEDKEGNYKAEIFSNQTDVPPHALYAFGGFFSILEQGKVLNFPALSHDARLAAGISQDGRTLYLLFAPGNFFGTAGLSFEETALILSKAGAWEALQFDGGSSASMSVSGKKIKKSGSRRVANIFAFTHAYDTNFN